MSLSVSEKGTKRANNIEQSENNEGTRMLVLVIGLPGSGKSTVARALASELKAKILRTDEIRKTMVQSPTYGEREKEIVYDAMLSAAGQLLENGENVILDATFYKEELRGRAKNLAEKLKKKFFVIECRAHEEVIRKRMEKRKKSIKSLSDADFEVYKKLKEKFEPIKKNADEHVAIDTSYLNKNEIREILRKAIKKIKAGESNPEQG